jgi:uncharacterized protein YqgC (DUF456 family)
MTDLQIAWALLIAGLVGAVVPVLPGTPLAFLGPTYYAYKTQWAEVAPLTIAALLVLAILGSTADIWLSSLAAKKSGASGWATVASIVGGIVGLLVASLPGAILGSIGAIVLVEYSRHKDWNQVMRASGGYLAGYLASMVLQVLIVLLMMGIFWAALKW